MFAIGVPVPYYALQQKRSNLFFFKLKNVSTAAEGNENFLGQKSRTAACGMRYAFGFHWLYLAFFAMIS